MKKAIVLAALGVAAVGSSYGQGYINFNSYAQTVTPYPVATVFGTATPLDSSFTAQLYYSLGTVLDPVDTGSAASIMSTVTGLSLFAGSDTPFAGGFFTGATLTIGSYVSGPITFEVVAFNGVDYASSSIRGRSGAFTMSSIDTSGVGSVFGDNGGVMPVMFAASAAPVPEPSTLALAGLGGLAMLALRRKKA